MTTRDDVIELNELPTDPGGQERLNAWLEHQPPQRILRWATNVLGSGLVVTSSFGLNGVVLIHMLQEFTQHIPIVFIDTGYLFKETLETKRRITAAYGVRVLTFRPALSVRAQARQYGLNLHAREPNLCCALRKVEPMWRAMVQLQPTAVLNGRARFQARTRRNLSIIEWERTPLRINPLAAWTRRQIEVYATAHQVPYNPLHDAGYPSVGCRPCTRPVQVGEHIRAGRWAGMAKTECGLWTTSYAAAD
jgi:phosphoadenosine phosphosulfate reductase